MVIINKSILRGNIMNKATIKVLIAMLLWGSLGVFVKNISLESVEISFFRGIIGSIFLGIVLLIKMRSKKKSRSVVDGIIFHLVQNLQGIGQGFGNILKQGVHLSLCLHPFLLGIKHSGSFILSS